MISLMAKFWVYRDKLELCPKNLSSINSFGEFKHYYKNGLSREICTYINGKKNGEYKLYYINGQIWKICTYINGKANGERKEYEEDGILIEQTFWKNGKKLKKK